MTTIIGIDPDTQGGFAVIEHNGVYACGYHTPNMRMGARRTEIDLCTLGDVIESISERYGVVKAVIESCSPLPGDGMASVRSVGQSYGSWLGLLSGLRIDTTRILPQRWKGMHNLLGCDKEASRQLAIKLYPDAVKDFPLKKNHGVAEALLIADAGFTLHERGLLA